MAPPAPEGSITIDQGEGPFHYGDTLTFTTETSKLRGGYPMVAVHLFQEAAPGEEEDPALVWVQLNRPDQAVILGGGESGLDKTKPAKGRATLYRYAWKGGQESIDALATSGFYAEP